MKALHISTSPSYAHRALRAAFANLSFSGVSAVHVCGIHTRSTEPVDAGRSETRRIRRIAGVAQPGSAKPLSKVPATCSGALIRPTLA